MSSRVVAQVKVTNLNKKTKRRHIQGRLKRFSILDVKLIRPYAKQTNHAYIHLQDYDTAQQVAEAIDRRMTIHTNLLRAVVKEGFSRGRGQEYDYDPYYSEAETTYQTEDEQEYDIEQEQEYHHYTHPAEEKQECVVAKATQPDLQLVDVLVYDKECSITDAELKVHFERYGKMDSVTTKYADYPRTVSIHYSAVISAHAARYDSPHCIQKATVIATPLQGSVPFGSKVTTMELDCKPMVLKYAEKEILREFCDNSRYKIIRKKNTLVVHFQGDSNDLEKDKIVGIIRSYESMLNCFNLELHYHFLPILAEAKVQHKIAALEIPFEVNVMKGTTVASLEAFSQEYSDSHGDLQGMSTLQQYLSPSTSENNKAQYKWYWKDDDNKYKPYSEEVNKRIETYHARKSNFFQEIGRFTYIISCITMTQTNTVTGKSRPLKREQISEEILVINLRIRAIQSHLATVKREITRLMAEFNTETKLEVPETAMQSGTFLDSMKKLKKEKLVQITFDKDQNSSLLIQGKPSIVNEVELRLHKTLLRLVADQSFHVTVPKTWEPQTSKCELKEIQRGTSEWKNIQDQMEQPDFAVRIHKIERIQNEWLWELYQLSKKRMSQKNDGEVNEKALFHGTRQTSPKDIYDSEQGFDNRLASKGLWGEGTYFAAKAKYSDGYAHPIKSGYKQMFLAQVITGVAYKHPSKDGNLKAPPKKEDHVSFFASLFYTQKAKFEGERYDSITATANGSKIYVIYELGRVYPAYLITYSTI